MKDIIDVPGFSITDLISNFVDQYSTVQKEYRILISEV
jgi:hypothetical protein